ncbi:MAG: DUF1653 domain-containing protein [Bacilli bacterium]
MAYDSEATDENGPGEVVVYEALYGKHLIWTRPYDLFNSFVDKETYPDSDQTYSFEQVD